MKKALLFANGRITPGPLLQRVLAEAGDFAHIICADGGARQAQALGLLPRCIIGDLDSLSPAEVAAFRAAGVEIRQYSAEKDETDLELALRHCRALGVDRITILGALGGRIDQTLANIFLLALPALAAIDIEIVDGGQRLRLMRPGRHQLLGAPGDTISLISLGAAAAGISTKNLKYALHAESLQFGPARGLSNVMLAERAEITFERGLLLLAHTCGRA